MCESATSLCALLYEQPLFAQFSTSHSECARACCRMGSRRHRCRRAAAARRLLPRRPVARVARRRPGAAQWSWTGSGWWSMRRRWRACCREVSEPWGGGGGEGEGERASGLSHFLQCMCMNQEHDLGRLLLANASRASRIPGRSACAPLLQPGRCAACPMHVFPSCRSGRCGRVPLVP